MTSQKLRNDQGWLIPREGTRSRVIYECLREGEPFATICAAFPELKSKHVAAIIWKIQNPERRNQLQRRKFLMPPRPKKKWQRPCIYEVLSLPAPRTPAPVKWHDIDSEPPPTEVWIWARARGSRVKVVSYEAAQQRSLFPWLWRDRTMRSRWDIFDEWRNEPAGKAR